MIFTLNQLENAVCKQVTVCKQINCLDHSFILYIWLKKVGKGRQCEISLGSHMLCRYDHLYLSIVLMTSVSDLYLAGTNTIYCLKRSLWEFTLLYHSSFSRPELLHGSRISVTIYSNFLLERKDLHYKVNLKEFKVINYVSVTHRLSDTLFRNTFRTNILTILRESLRDLKNKTTFVIPKIILNLERSLQENARRFQH